MEDLFKKRIGYKSNITRISKEICRDYGLGVFVSQEIILIGYEDFNFVLTTSTGKYFVKVFAKFRDMNNCQRYIDIMKSVIGAGVATPKLYKSKQGFLHIMKMDKYDLRLCVMEYIPGNNLYKRRGSLSNNDIKFLAQQAALINSIKIKPFFVYDSWAICNFKKEYAAKSKYFNEEDKALITPLIKEFDELQIEKLPRCFAHGDIINTNVIRDESADLHIIDFSVSNFYPRIQELAVLACNLLFNEKNSEKSDKNLKLALDEYQNYIQLTGQELNVLPKYIRLAHAMHLLSANYQKVAEKNNSEENEYWLNLGRTSLKQTH